MHDLITGIARCKVLKKRTYIKLKCHYSDLYIYIMDNIDRTRSF